MKVKITSFILLFSLLFGAIVPVEGKLTEECKQYIARYLGEKVGDKYCFTDSTAKKVKYWTPTGEEILGSTVDAVNSIVFLGAYSYEDPVNKVGKITADTLRQKNGGNALTNDDIVWIANHSDGANKYCYSPTAPPTTTPTPTPATPQTTQTETTPSTPGFEVILTAIIILLILVTKKY